MASWLSSTAFSPSLPDHCTPQNYFLTRLSSDFHTCIPTPLAFFSTLLGSFSILSWLFAQLPQIVKNYNLQSTSGLSIFFLIEWCLGDATNLFGALLTNQATWQVIVAGYYVFVDVVLVLQYVWYTHFKPWREERQAAQGGRASRDSASRGPAVIEGVSGSGEASSRPSSSSDPNQNDKSSSKPLPAPFNAFRFPASFSPREKGTPSSSHPTIHRLRQNNPSPAPSPKTLLLLAMLCAVLGTASPPPHTTLTTSDPPPPSPTFPLGRLLSWTSTLLYLGSRLPQLYKNHTRRSTTGLSPSLFLAAFFGNLFYSASLLANPLAWASVPPFGIHGWAGPAGSDRPTWRALAAPFFLGAAGVLALDAAMGAQFLAYGEGGTVVRVRVRDRRGRGHWRRVSGWMRGWVPSGQVEGEREGEGVLVRGAGRGLLGEGVGRGYGGVERGVVRGG
ncbi:hypothetical protein MMC34_002308 [Xylographa carneopallida]|nr:hypothetical protein [Xylographa carneopallida]